VSAGRLLKTNRAAYREVTDSLRVPAHYVAMGKTRIRYISAVFLLLGVIIGGALVALLLRPLVYRPPAESTEITQAIQDLQAGQRKAADQLQAIQQVLGADHDQVKQLSGQVAALNDKLEPLRESFAGGQQANAPAASPATRRRGAR
jgi:hypothetical protein